MIDRKGFEEWMLENSVYSKKEIADIEQTVVTADGMLPWKEGCDERVYEYALEAAIREISPNYNGGISSFRGALRMYGVFMRKGR